MEESPTRKITFLDILFFPLHIMLEYPLIPVFILILGCLIGIYCYYWVNTDFWGFARPDYQSYEFINNYNLVKDLDGYKWIITYENNIESVYDGKISEIFPVRTGMFPFLTHDILVTSGDFSNPNIVTTNVFDHHFYWSSNQTQQPHGSIHLIHAVPKDEAVYNQLLLIKKDQTLVIRGMEILRIDHFQKSGNYDGKWEDAGCNTLLINSVQFK